MERETDGRDGDGSEAIRDELGQWLVSGDEPVGILTGSAGSGKTTLLRHVLDRASDLGDLAQAMAPTGRAARILSQRTGREARTIHSCIYGLSSVDVVEQGRDAGPLARLTFPLRDEPPGVSLIVVDEASMVGDLDTKQELLRFGSGRLLSDLLKWARLDPDRSPKILFVGDPFQLPPVGEDRSPALDPATFRANGLGVRLFELTRVFRQREGSAILDAAIQLRDEMKSGDPVTMALATGGDVFDANVASMLDAIAKNPDGCLAIARSNARCLQHNRAVRSLRFDGSGSAPVAGDRLLAVRNSRIGLLNGDIVRVTRVGACERRLVRLKGAPEVELAFRNVTVQHGDRLIEAVILENLLDDHERELPMLLAQATMADFEKRVGLPRNSPAYIDALLNDPYVNALHVKYGYCITCHKSQGGEWPTVYVDFHDVGNSTDSFRWAYTAITRASSALHLIGAPRVSRFSALADAAGADEPPPQPEQLEAGLPEGFDCVKIRDLNHGVRYVVSHDGDEAYLDVFSRKGGKRSYHHVSGSRGLFDRVEAAFIEQEIASLRPGEGERSFQDQLMKVAPAGGCVRIVALEPYAVTLEFQIDGTTERVRFTHDKRFRWNDPTGIRSEIVLAWIRRAAIE